MSIDINSAWEELKNRVQNCQKCKLCENRHNTVFGEGPVENCKVMIIGEGPGEEEDSRYPVLGR